MIVDIPFCLWMSFWFHDVYIFDAEKGLAIKFYSFFDVYRFAKCIELAKDDIIIYKLFTWCDEIIKKMIYTCNIVNFDT